MKRTLEELRTKDGFEEGCFLITFLKTVELLRWNYEAELDSCNGMVYLEFYPSRDKWESQRYTATFYPSGNLEDIDCALEVEKFESEALGIVPGEESKKDIAIRDCQKAVVSLINLFEK